MILVETNRMLNRLIILMSLINLSACSMVETVSDLIGGDDDTADPPAPLVEFRQRLNVVKLWTENTGSGTDEQYLKLSPVFAQQKFMWLMPEAR